MSPGDRAKKHVPTRDGIQLGEDHREIKSDGNNRREPLHSPAAGPEIGTKDNDPPKIHGTPDLPSGTTKVRQSGTGAIGRKEISSSSLFHKYKRIRTLDAGHGSIGGYADAYIRESPFEASLYMEHCDRGTLEDLIKFYREKKGEGSPSRIPESFIWHAFVGLSDALGYLQTGQSKLAKSPDRNDPNEWKPLVHCDIKPGNIFLRSRDTPGSRKPFYVLLSDFGLMGYERNNQRAPYSSYGTMEFHAPELAFDPFPEDHEMKYMASPHTCKSDVWALACTIFCMCERDGMAQMKRDCGPLRSQKALGRTAKRTFLDITDVDIYSDYLSQAILWAGDRDPLERPDSSALVDGVKVQYDLWRDDPKWKSQVQVNGALPPGATPTFTL
ncbi:hypothetical protein ONZ43_g3387 [Nemania bipapillata]|uniref:Uncharacterized protein n=1 Tax=Nemania bipapillata TaxID=110536 RepID=A0ACC2IXN0_9PEZI|nr:hypothetical protein ONZ43_g3387 [Nemania bipapillata]